MFRTTLSSTTSKAAIASRQFHCSPAARKTVTEKVSELADKVNKGVGAGLASAIDKGEQATNAAKETLDATSKETKQKAKETGTTIKQEDNEAAATTRKVKEDISKNL
ncbi:hypothetical protein CVT25_014397 [Psilocybe cyanescens]|uniref:Uncharacterized protein n=1 Tax=Psilocybe cyanescens TaxID=93625 RepID=A0A409XBD4_PSICY|nr:hypothetical protein CVT25_014397 [Psilocybe cyanescens]